MELSRKHGALTLGMPKCKKPWKITSERHSKHKPFGAPKKWEKKMQDKRQLKAVRDRVRAERERLKEERK